MKTFVHNPASTNTATLLSPHNTELPLHPSDTIFVTVMQYGKTLMSGLTLTGCSTMAEIKESLRSIVGSVQGLVTVSFRNRSQGWTSSTSIRFARPSMSLLASA